LFGLGLLSECLIRRPASGGSSGPEALDIGAERSALLGVEVLVSLLLDIARVLLEQVADGVLAGKALCRRLRHVAIGIGNGARGPIAEPLQATGLLTALPGELLGEALVFVRLGRYFKIGERI
jgi:hypothetical protein